MRRQILYHCATREALHGYLVVSFLSHGKMWSKKRGLWDALSLQTVILPLLKLPRIFKKTRGQREHSQSFSDDKGTEAVDSYIPSMYPVWDKGSGTWASTELSPSPWGHLDMQLQPLLMPAAPFSLPW